MKTAGRLDVYSTVDVHTGHSDLDLRAHIITDEDKGALYSWQATQQCSESYANPNDWSGPYTYTQTDPCPTDPEAHLTTTSGASIVRDVVWDPGNLPWNGVEPVLQLEGGSFAASTADGLITFDATGRIKWTAPGLSPSIAMPGGGVIAESWSGAVEFDKDGATLGAGYAPYARSWLDHVYRVGSVERLNVWPATIASTFWPVRFGNLSANGGAAPVERIRVAITENPAGQEDLVRIRLVQILGKLTTESQTTKASCSTWLQRPADTSVTWSVYIPMILEQTMYRRGLFSLETESGGKTKTRPGDEFAATVNGVNPGETADVLPPGVLLAVNDVGAFYKSAFLDGSPYADDNRGSYGGGNPRAQAETLLHELAHLIVPQKAMPPDQQARGFRPDFAQKDDTSAQRFNRSLLNSTCGDLIRSFPR